MKYVCLIDFSHWFSLFVGIVVVFVNTYFQKLLIFFLSKMDKFNTERWSSICAVKMKMHLTEVLINKKKCNNIFLTKIKKKNLTFTKLSFIALHRFSKWVQERKNRSYVRSFTSLKSRTYCKLHRSRLFNEVNERTSVF